MTVESSSVVDISIVIPSYNRGELVRENVEKSLLLKPAPKEIILVDDCSGDDSAAILQQLADAHESVHYYRLDENGGQAVARSVAFEKATGRYIVSLDDDSWFIDQDGLQRVWDRFEQLNQCAILSFETFAPVKPITEAVDQLFLVSDHITCGAAYRTEVLRQSGYHLGFLRYEGEEADLSLKIIGLGYDIVHDCNIRVFHDYDPEKRTSATLNRVRRYAVRNDLVRAVIYFPWLTTCRLLLWRSLSHLKYALKKGYLWPTLVGYAGFFRLLFKAIAHRQPISRAASHRYFALRRKRQPLSS